MEQESLAFSDEPTRAESQKRASYATETTDTGHYAMGNGIVILFFKNNAITILLHPAVKTH